MTERPDLMIGDFARRSRLPISTLHYYDKIGLLTPAAIDPGSGYRRYSADQLPTAALIARLRSLGISPDSIARILPGGSSAATVLRRERQRLAQEIEIRHDRLTRLDEFLSEGPPGDYRVDVITLAAREVAAHPYLLPADKLAEGVTRAIARLRSALRRDHLDRAGAWGATFPVDLVDDVGGLVFAPIDDNGHDLHVDTAWLPSTSAVATVHHGSPESLPSAYDAAFSALDERGVVPAEPVIEEYLTLDEPGSPAQLIRVCIPFRQPTDCES
jgi:DNA-binding transcriptional MerR regulator